MTDQQHFRTLGCHGVAEARTPNLDRLARGGLDFRNHFVSNPVCSPSRASIITGMHTTQHGLWGNGCRLPENVPTLPQVMNRAGFQTAHFGKLHLIPIIPRVEEHPSYGFETCQVAEGDQQLTHDAYFAWLRKNDPDLFVRFLTEMYEKGHAQGYKSLMPEEKHQSTWTTGRAIDWLRNRRSTSEPFFLSVGYFDPHHAFNPCEPYASMYDAIDVTPPIFEEEALESKPPHYQTLYRSVCKHTRDPARMAAILKAYHAMCAHVDHCVGQLLSTLAELELDRETAVVFTSDHGEFMGNHGLLWKGPYLLDDLLRVPLIISIPGALRQGSTVQSLSSSIDLMATVQRLAGVGDPHDASGRPIVGNDGTVDPEGPRDHVLAEWEAPKPGLSESLRCYRTAEAKLVSYLGRDEHGELYDLANDPHELHNRYHDPSYAALRRTLHTRLSRHVRPRPETAWEGGW